MGFNKTEGQRGRSISLHRIIPTPIFPLQVQHSQGLLRTFPKVLNSKKPKAKNSLSLLKSISLFKPKAEEAKIQAMPTIKGFPIRECFVRTWVGGYSDMVGKQSAKQTDCRNLPDFVTLSRPNWLKDDPKFHVTRLYQKTERAFATRQQNQQKHRSQERLPKTLPPQNELSGWDHIENPYITK